MQVDWEVPGIMSMIQTKDPWHEWVESLNVKIEIILATWLKNSSYIN